MSPIDLVHMRSGSTHDFHNLVLPIGLKILKALGCLTAHSIFLLLTMLGSGFKIHCGEVSRTKSMTGAVL